MSAVKSNVTGTVFKILVNLGDKITADQDVMILESMKMEMLVQSPASGTVKEIKVAIDDYVEEGQEVLTLE